LKLLKGELASKPKTQLTCDAWISWDLQVKKLRLKDEMRVERRNEAEKRVTTVGSTLLLLLQNMLAKVCVTT
jgi:hypothetical protein